MAIPYVFNRMGCGDFAITIEPVWGFCGVWLTRSDGVTITRSGMEMSGAVLMPLQNACQFVWSGGIADNTVINSGTRQDVYSGGMATGATVNSKGAQTIMGGYAVSTTVKAAATINLITGSAAGLHVSSGGNIQITTGTISDLKLEGGRLDLGRSDMLVSGGILSDGAVLNVSGHAVAREVQVLDGASAFIGGNGSAVGFELAAGAYMSVGLGAQVIEVVQSGGAMMNVTLYGEDSDTVVTGSNASGAMSYSNGVASNLILQNVSMYYGAVAFDMTLLSGGKGSLFNGASAIGTVVESGASMMLESNTYGAETRILAGGVQYLYEYAVESGGMVSGGVQSVGRYASALGVSVLSGGSQLLAPGGSAVSGQILSGGLEIVSSNARDSAGAAHPGGTIRVLQNGSSTDARVLSGGTLAVAPQGAAIGVDIASGGRLSYEFNAIVTGVSTGTALPDAGGTRCLNIEISSLLSVSSGYVAENVSVFAGGRLSIAAGGTALAPDIRSGGQLQADGNAFVTGIFCEPGAFITNPDGGTFADDIRLITFSRSSVIGTASDDMPGLILSNAGGFAGTQYIYTGGTATGNQVFYGGTQTVKSGGVAAATELNSSGWQYVMDGGAATDAAVNAMGRQIVSSGGLAIRPTIKSGGSLYVSSGGTALDVVSVAGARIGSDAGAVITYQEATA